MTRSGQLYDLVGLIGSGHLVSLYDLYRSLPRSGATGQFVYEDAGSLASRRCRHRCRHFLAEDRHRRDNLLAKA